MDTPEFRQRKKKKSTHLFERDVDGYTRIRVVLEPELADLIEEAAAGRTPVVQWMKRALWTTARYQVSRRQMLHGDDDDY